LPESGAEKVLGDSFDSARRNKIKTLSLPCRQAHHWG
jgi:hypothetical protein